MPLTVAIVEDDEDLAEELHYHIQAAGIVAFRATSSASLKQLILQEPIDVVLLDLGLPDEDGLPIAQWLSLDAGKRVVMLTARASVMDRVEGFSSGADIYLTKPVDMRELIGAIRSVARRLPAHDSDTVIDLQRSALCRGHLQVLLTGLEMEFMLCLARAATARVSKMEIEQALYPAGDATANRKLEVLLSRLRGKLEKTGFKNLIRTDWGRGFTLTERVLVAGQARAEK